MGRTIIHIGMPRTASTYFQQEYFPKLSGFSFYGIDTTYISDAFQRMLYQDDSLFDENLFEETAAKIRSQNAVLSNELFVGQSLFINATNRSRTARRLKIFFPEAEIVLVLRNQVSLLQSLYAIGVYSGHSCTTEEFIRFSNLPSSSASPLYPTFSVAENTESYKFSHLIRLYKHNFSRVHILLFEDFKDNPLAFAERLSNMLHLENVIVNSSSTKINHSLTQRQIGIIRRLNKYKDLINRGKVGNWIFANKLRFIEHYLIGQKSFKFSSKLEIKLRNYYRDDNRAITEILPEFQNSTTYRKYYLNTDSPTI